MALQQEMPALQKGGIKVVAITAEPGGSEAVRQRLLERNVPAVLDFDIESDPDHVFRNKCPADLFVLKDHDWEVSGPYKLIQPALVVYDASGNLINECSWSWKTMGVPTGDATLRVDTQAWAGPIKQVLLVTMRPVMSDLLAAIQEKRPVKLASTHDNW